MPETYTVSDQRADTAMVMALSEANAFEHFLKGRAAALRKEADLIDAFLEGQIDAWERIRGHTKAPSHEVRSWYNVIHAERAAAEAALKSKD